MYMHLAKDSAVTRESKLALILTFVLILVVGVLVSDHFSQANLMDQDLLDGQNRQPIAQLPGTDRSRIDHAIDQVMPRKQSVNQPQAQPNATPDGPVVIANGSNHNGSLLNELSNGLSKTIDELRAPALASQSRPLGSIEQKTYTVREGDSLYRIAVKALGDGNRWTEIQKLNAKLIGSDGIINPGMKLTLPGNARVSTPKPADRANSTKPPVSSKNPKTYTVASGDTLGEISIKFLDTSKRMDEIVTLNGLDDANDIRVGMKLKIPTK